MTVFLASFSLKLKKKHAVFSDGVVIIIYKIQRGVNQVSMMSSSLDLRNEITF